MKFTRHNRPGGASYEAEQAPYRFTIRRAPTGAGWALTVINDVAY